MKIPLRTTLAGLTLLLGLGTLAVAIGADRPGPWSLVSVPADQVSREVLGDLDVDVEGGSRTHLHIQARADAIEQMRARGLDVEVLVDDVSAQRPESGDPEQRGMAYHDPEGMTWSLRALADTYPDVVRVVEVGRSWQGRAMTGVVITDQPWTREQDEPSMRILGGHHGDEWSSMEVALDVAWTLVEAWDSGDEEVVAFVESHELWVVPMVNPDGAVAFERRNSNNVDLNRNYAYQWLSWGATGDHPFSEVETAAIRQLSIARSFHHSVSIHSGAANLGWLWNYTYDLTVDDDWMSQLCGIYLEDNVQPGFWITNGADWYATNGDTNDWSYGERGGHDYNLEVTETKAPPEDEIAEYTGWHAWPSINFLVNGSKAGVRGRVHDGSGRGIEAELVPQARPWPTFSDPETGAFGRPGLPGTWVLDVSAPGYVSQTVTVEVLADAATVIDIELVPLAPGVTVEVYDAELDADKGGELLLCGEATSGLEPGDIHLLRAWDEQDTLPFDRIDDCVVVEVDPGSVIGDSWRREGEWSLLLDEPGLLLQGVLLLAAGDPGFEVDDLEVELQDDGSTRIDVLGDDLPEGALIRFRGPHGERVWPQVRATGDEPERITAFVDGVDWADGDWSLRVFGAGHWAAITDAITAEGGVLEAGKPEKPTEEPTTEKPTEEPTEEPTEQPTATPPGLEPGGFEGTGCACRSSNTGQGTSLLALALAGLALYLRRRPRRWM
jgi:carboxypeptidase T